LLDVGDTRQAAKLPRVRIRTNPKGLISTVPGVTTSPTGAVTFPNWRCKAHLVRPNLGSIEVSQFPRSSPCMTPWSTSFTHV
jgi:hypothetical protein